MIYKKLGILGGMGPLATHYLYKSIIDSTPAEKDQEHIDMVLLNAANIPDRTASILGSGESPLPYLISGCKTLEKAGCDVIAIACNTSHYFYDDIQKACSVKIINMVDTVAERLSGQKVKTVYIMATSGTIKSGIYERNINARNITVLPVSDHDISTVMKVIYDLKAGISPDLTEIIKLANKVYLQGCTKIILACTELSLIKEDMENLLKLEHTDRELDGLFVDSTDVLKDKILEIFNVQKRV